MTITAINSSTTVVYDTHNDTTTTSTMNSTSANTSRYQYSCLGAVTMYKEQLKIPSYNIATNNSNHTSQSCKISNGAMISADNAPMHCNNSDDKSTKRRSSMVSFPIYTKPKMDAPHPMITTDTNNTAYNNSDMIIESSSPLYCSLRHSLSAPSLAATVESATSNFLDGSLHTSCSSTSSPAVGVDYRNSFSTGNLCELGGDTVITSTVSKRRVSLADSVSVVPIPSRCEYPDVVRCRLWSNPLEMYQNAARNSIEFAYEGWDWRAVYEDDAMCVCSQSGELIHPIHFYLNSVNSNEAATTDGDKKEEDTLMDTS